ncbi:MAG: chalcone isomerase family protein [Pseudomonadota bacterium]
MQAALAAPEAAGGGLLRFWGFEIYNASLWVQQGFRHNDFASHPFALELGYLRSFTAREIAERSLQEMARLAPIAPEQAEQWQRALAASFPDVKRGDRITGMHRPGEGVRFFTNGKLTGEIRDAGFARLFFGIWLSPATREPVLRQSLLGKTEP